MTLALSAVKQLLRQQEFSPGGVDWVGAVSVDIDRRVHAGVKGEDGHWSAVNDDFDCLCRSTDAAGWVQAVVMKLALCLCYRDNEDNLRCILKLIGTLLSVI